ncbi:syntaxin-71-like isoform X3 [Brassica napus]|nr:syntaxin-71-like isoform X2 [Brassica napus]XP_048614794.1 syntaxin-71-like isoform X2 [Brassica napus]XP_048614795.1 syntaxin-71-like isoform X3 [Brassica napus]
MGVFGTRVSEERQQDFYFLFLFFSFFSFHAFGVPRLLRLSTIESQNPPCLLSLLRLRRLTTLSVITASPPCSPSDETLNQSWKPRETLSGSHVVSSIFSPSEIGLFLCFALIQVKGLTTEELAARNDLVLALPARIEAIPDGTAGGPKSTSAWAPSTTSRPDIKFDSDGRFDDDYFQESHESSQFRQEFEMRKIKQAGLDALKNMASDMNEELDRQVSLMDEIDSKVVNMASQFRA